MPFKKGSNMGACSYFFKVKGKLNQDECNEKLREQQEIDRYENGHQEGYSGDSQTVHKVILHNKNFDDDNIALDYCLKHSEKWEFFIAVYVKNEYTFIGGWGAC
jgi:hypothetical protein